MALASAANAAPAPDNATKFPSGYPSKPIRLLVSGVGGAGDFAGRLIATELTQRLGQQVVIDNRPGGVTPGEILVKAQPDGYTLMMVGFVIWLSPFMREGVPFDPLRDFTPVSLAISSPNVLVVHPSLRVKSVPDLIALAKQKPGALNYGVSGIEAVGNTPAEFAAIIREDMARKGKIIRDAGIRME